jgi:hypothetical protein
VRDASSSASPACLAALIRPVITGIGGSRPAATSWPRLKAARLSVSLRVPGRAAATRAVSARSAAIAYARPWARSAGGSRCAGTAGGADGSVTSRASHGGSGAGGRGSLLAVYGRPATRLPAPTTYPPSARTSTCGATAPAEFRASAWPPALSAVKYRWQPPDGVSTT